MPPLIPTNTSLIPTYPVPESDHKILPSDDEIHQNIENQTQLVKKLRQILLEEEMKLGMMMRMWKARKMNHGQSQKRRRGRPPGSKNKKTFYYFHFGEQEAKKENTI